MGLFDIFKSDKSKVSSVGDSINMDETDPNSDYYLGYAGGFHNPIIEESFDGEKTPGELGDVIESMPDHLRLRLRAYDARLKTDLVEIIVGRFIKWIIGKGLKINSNPDQTVLKMFGVKEDTIELQKNIESFFNLYADSNFSDYVNSDNIHEKAKEAYLASFLGGDALCVVRVTEKGPNIQVIDGDKVESPIDSELKGDGNTIIKGIEVDKKGEHIAFWVQKSVQGENNIDVLEHERIKAKDSKGRKMAWMVYGTKHRINHHRGIPVISSVLEKLNKLDRFTEATVKAKEEVANVVYAFEHDETSTGVNIAAQNFGPKKNKGEQKSSYELSGRTESQLRQSTSGQVLNLVPGSSLKQLSMQGGEDFNVFQRGVFNFLCAAVGIPPEVALQLYEQNYSSSRAAINGWEYMNEIDRDRFAKKFYEPYYRIWLEYFTLKGVIKNKSLLNAFNNRDEMVLEAFFKATFLGNKMPHIDPLKEAKAVRTMLGDDSTPLITYEQATSMLNGGDWRNNIEKHKTESEIAPKPKEENNVISKNKNTKQ